MKEKIRFDARRFLEDLGYAYKEKGKNIMKNFVGLNCFKCPTPDPSEHLNIRVDGWFALCFRCGLRVKGARDVMELLVGRKLNNVEFLGLLRKYGLDGNNGGRVVVVEKKKFLDTELVKEWNRFRELRKVDIKYLNGRGIRKDFAEWWGLRSGVDKFFYYVVVPFRDEDGNLVGYIGRAVTDKAEPKYLNSGNNVRQYLFGLYECRKNIEKDGYILIVEGVFDVLKGQQEGLNAVGLCGKSMTDGQLLQLLRVCGRGVRVYVMLDADAVEDERAIVEVLSGYFDKVKGLRLLKHKDIAEMSSDELWELKSDLIGLEYN